MNLRIPGPTPCAQEALEAMSRQMINHRGPEFGAILKRVTSGVQEVFQTKNDVFILTTSGTGAMETAVVNLLSPGDKVLCVSIGAFGDRFGDIAKTYGADVTKLSFEWGKAADPAELDKALSAGRGYKAVLITHNETSTGVTNPLRELAAVARKHDVLIVVDAVSSLSAVPCPVDALGPRRRRHRLAEGLDGAAGAGHDLGERAGLEGERGGEDAPLLLRRGEGKEVSGNRPDAVDARDLRVLRAGRGAGDDAGRRPGEHLRAARADREAHPRGREGAGPGAAGRRAFRLEHGHGGEGAGGRRRQGCW